jgi:predicted RNA-binding Zn-ribbon protein involved in translation (DUF1610 family)
MEYKTVKCGHCENIISINDNNEKTYVCPVCGSINDRESNKLYSGSISIISNEMKVMMDDAGNIGIQEDEYNEDLIHALTIMTKYGWGMTFKGVEIPKEEFDDDDDYIDEGI